VRGFFDLAESSVCNFTYFYLCRRPRKSDNSAIAFSPAPNTFILVLKLIDSRGSVSMAQASVLPTRPHPFTV
jgi:hypothetical protein